MTTPSLMTGEEVDRLLCDIRALLPLAPDCEITLEANPGTMEAQRFRDFTLVRRVNAIFARNYMPKEGALRPLRRFWMVA